jgi:hypothetical protein
VKTTVTEATEARGKAYPYMGILPDKGIIVLFTSEDTGMVLHKGEGRWPVGDYEDGQWREEDFAVFQGTLTLENN